MLFEIYGNLRRHAVLQFGIVGGVEADFDIELLCRTLVRNGKYYSSIIRSLADAVYGAILITRPSCSEVTISVPTMATGVFAATTSPSLT